MSILESGIISLDNLFELAIGVNHFDINDKKRKVLLKGIRALSTQIPAEQGFYAFLNRDSDGLIIKYLGVTGLGQKDNSGLRSRFQSHSKNTGLYHKNPIELTSYQDPKGEKAFYKKRLAGYQNWKPFNAFIWVSVPQLSSQELDVMETWLIVEFDPPGNKDKKKAAIPEIDVVLGEEIKQNFLNKHTTNL